MIIKYSIKGMVGIFLLLVSLGGSMGLRNPSSYDEYDCDSNGAKDCSAWDYKNMKCAQPNTHAANIRVQRICIKGASFGVLEFRVFKTDTNEEIYRSGMYSVSKTRCAELGSIRGVKAGDRLRIQTKVLLGITRALDTDVVYSPFGITATAKCSGVAIDYVCTLTNIPEAPQAPQHEREWCKREFHFGDLTMGQSCRCRRYCPNMLPGELPDSFVFEMPHWHNWAHHVDTCIPWLMPSNRDDLFRILRQASTYGFKVRPGGATHSAPGLVTEGDENNGDVVVVSLGKYSTSVPGATPGQTEREYYLDEMGKTVWVNAGWSFLDLYSRIRPRGYFTPVQTAGYFFQIGGTVANTVHGGAYGKSFFHKYVTAMQVVTVDARGQPRERIIDSEAELRWWRNSYGLLGIITAVKLQVEQRGVERGFRMFSLDKHFIWNQQNFWNFIHDDADGHSTGVRRQNGEVKTEGAYDGEFFVSFTDTKVRAVVIGSTYKNTQPNWNVQTRIALKDAYKAKLRSRDYAHIRTAGCPDHDTLGISTTKLLSLGIQPLSSIGGKSLAAKLLVENTLNRLPLMMEAQSKDVNDGFFAMAAPRVAIAAYFVPVADAFAAMNALRDVVQRDTKGHWSQPAEFRFMTITDDAVLNVVPPGTYMVSEFLTFPDASGAGYKDAFAEVERIWTRRYRGKPHVGKLFGYGGPDNQPFTNRAIICGIYPDSVKSRFRAKSREEDPTGMFWAGFATKMLTPKNERGSFCGGSDGSARGVNNVAFKEDNGEENVIKVTQKQIEIDVMAGLTTTPNASYHEITAEQIIARVSTSALHMNSMDKTQPNDDETVTGVTTTAVTISDSQKNTTQTATIGTTITDSVNTATVMPTTAVDVTTVSADNEGEAQSSFNHQIDSISITDTPEDSMSSESSAQSDASNPASSSKPELAVAFLTIWIGLGFWLGARG